MNSKKTIFTYILTIGSIFLFVTCKQQTSEKTSNHQSQEKANSGFASKLTWVSAKIEDENYSIWGSSPIIGDDGKIHVFAARWPEYNIDPAWRKSSEIAHYIADSVNGKYEFNSITIKGSGIDNAWDRYAPHNPEIKKIGDYYAIVYIANSDYQQPPHPGNQKIGLIYSKSLYGPWKKAGQNGLILEPSKDPNHWTHQSGLGVDNPCLNMIDGKIVVYFKNRTTVNGKIKAKYGYALADQIEGPYTMSDNAITNNDSYLEDATTFTWNNKYYLLSTDNFGTVSGVPGGGTLWESTNWKNFSLDNTTLGFDLIPKYLKNYNENNATKIYGKSPKFQRSKILMQHGNPGYLYVPSGWNIDGGQRSVCYILKINQ